jgi:hypothetical protein
MFGGVHGAIKMMIYFIIFIFTWMIGRLFVLPHINVGIPALPPYPASQGIYNAIYNTCIYVLGYITAFVMVIYAIYFFFTYIMRWFIIIPLYKIIRKITPIKQFIECGLFPMIDSILFLWFPRRGRRASLKDRIFGTVNALAAFFAKSIRYLVITLTGRDPYNPKPAATVQKPTLTIDVGTMSVGKYDPTKKDLLEKENLQKTIEEEAGVKITTREVTSGSDAFNQAAVAPGNQFEEKVDDVEIDENPKLTVDERKYIHTEYNRCMAENYIPFDPSLSAIDKASVQVKNIAAQTKCNVTKLQAYSKMFNSLFNR